jgi:hypothetical protein
VYKEYTILLRMTEFKDDLHETNRLIREVVLPQLVRIETELISLRKHVWPYVQARKEGGQCLSDIESKRDFLKNLDEDVMIELLKLKAKISGSDSTLRLREYDLTRNFC